MVWDCDEVNGLLKAKEIEGQFPEAGSESEAEYSSAEDQLRQGLLRSQRTIDIGSRQGEGLCQSHLVYLLLT